MLLIPACPLAATAELLDQPGKRVLVVAVPFRRLGRQSLHELLLASFLRSRTLCVLAVRCAGVDLADEAVGELEALIIVEYEAY